MTLLQRVSVTLISSNSRTDGEWLIRTTTLLPAKIQGSVSPKQSLRRLSSPFRLLSTNLFGGRENSIGEVGSNKIALCSQVSSSKFFWESLKT
jgi:hypothetical protein